MTDEHWSAVYDSARAVRVQRAAARSDSLSARPAFWSPSWRTRAASWSASTAHSPARPVARTAGNSSPAWSPADTPRRSHTGAFAAVGSTTCITSRSTKPSALPDDRNRKPQTIGRMVQRLMMLDGVLDDRSCWWMSSERDKRSYFATTRQIGLSAPQYPQIAFGSGPQKTIRYFPDKLPIGVRQARPRPSCLPVSRHADPADRLPACSCCDTRSCSACCTPGRFGCWSRVGSGRPRRSTRQPFATNSGRRSSRISPTGWRRTSASARGRRTHQRPVRRILGQGIPALRDGAVRQPVSSVAAHG